MHLDQPAKKRRMRGQSCRNCLNFKRRVRVGSVQSYPGSETSTSGGRSAIMESSSRLDNLPVSREIAGPRPGDGIGRALRNNFPAMTDISEDFARLLDEIDRVASINRGGSGFRPHP
jgi:hypothetical protein